MQFLIIFGPPAVGKMTVGNAIREQTGMPVFHNHLSIDPVLNFFPFGSEPFERLVGDFRRNLISEVANSELPGLIFTFVWSFSEDQDAEFLAGLCELFNDDANIAFVELRADLQERLIRNKSEDRLTAKPTKRDVAKSESLMLQHEKEHQMNSDGSIPFEYPHLQIDNTHLSAREVANRVIKELSLPTI